MRNLLVFHFVTLVLTSLVWASPDQQLEPSLIDVNPAKKESPSTNSQTPHDLSATAISSSPEASPRQALEKSWESATNMVLGYTDGVFDKNNKIFDSSFTLGIERTEYSQHSRGYSLSDEANEYGIQINRMNLIGVDWGHKWLISSAEDYEPFYKLGFAGYYDPADGLANIIDYQRYLIRGSVGAENLFRSFRRIKAEAGAGLGPVGISVFANLIYAFPD